MGSVEFVVYLLGAIAMAAWVCQPPIDRRQVFSIVILAIFWPFTLMATVCSAVLALRNIGSDDDPFFETVEELVNALSASFEGIEDAERKKKALRLGHELLRGTKYEVK